MNLQAKEGFPNIIQNKNAIEQKEIMYFNMLILKLELFGSVCSLHIVSGVLFI